VSAELLRDLARVKVIFQLKAIETIIRGKPAQNPLPSKDSPHA
jgi:hypothetical protein